MNKTSAGDVLDRLHTVYGVKNDSQLSEVAGLNRATVGNWRNRNSVPYSFCVDVAVEHGVSLDWLLTGKGDGAQEQAAKYAPDPLNSKEQAILALFRALNEQGQQEMLSAAQEKGRLGRLEQQVRELASAIEDIKKPA